MSGLGRGGIQSTYHTGCANHNDGVCGGGGGGQGYAFSSVAAMQLLPPMRRGNTSKRCKDFHPKCKARIWPWLSYMCHIHSIAGWEHVGAGPCG